jgi:fructose-1,6-bisphosphatase/inositol monophosphatase family enzyme
MSSIRSENVSKVLPFYYINYTTMTSFNESTQNLPKVRNTSNLSVLPPSLQNFFKSLTTNAEDICKKIIEIQGKIVKWEEEVKVKPDGTKETSADKVIEEYMYELFKKCNCPEAGISFFGEERDYENPENSSYTVIVDPVDGTSAMAKGKDGWGTMISVCDASGKVIYARNMIRQNNELTGHVLFQSWSIPVAKKEIAAVCSAGEKLKIDFYNYSNDKDAAFKSALENVYSLSADTCEITSFPAAIEAGYRLFTGDIQALVRVAGAKKKKTYPDYDLAFLKTLVDQWYHVAIGKSGEENAMIIVAPTKDDVQKLLEIGKTLSNPAYPIDRVLFDDLCIMQEKEDELIKKLLQFTISCRESVCMTQEQRQEFINLYTTYISRALGKWFTVISLIPFESTVSLNSLAAYVYIQTPDNKEIDTFCKIHIETNTGDTSIAQVWEYKATELLKEKWRPIISPLYITKWPYPLEVLPKLDMKTMFDIMQEAYQGWNGFDEKQITAFTNFQENVGKTLCTHLQKIPPQEAKDAPVQTLIGKRYREGGRIDQRYPDDKLFYLPWLKEPLLWKTLKNVQWNINGILWEKTLADLVQDARTLLKFPDEKEVFATFSHGDDHGGNLAFIKNGENYWYSDELYVFDAAYGGLNPTSIDVKWLAHLCYCPMGGMYSDPKNKENVSYSYDVEENVLSVSIDFSQTPFFLQHEKLARIIIDQRIIPLMKIIHQKGGNIDKERQRFKIALAACPLLTVHIAELLEKNNTAETKLGEWLLPLTMLMYRGTWFPSLEYLSQQIDSLKKS